MDLGRVAVGLLLAAVALAGCAGQGGTTGDDSLSGIKVAATPTTGVIRGVVVDTALHPVAGVRLTVLAADRTLTTNSSAIGAFGFDGLAPGTYFVQAHKLGYDDVQTSAEVRAGDDTPPMTKIAMTPNLAARPYVDPCVFKGFIECSTPVIALCSAPNLGPQFVAIITCNEPVNQTAPCTRPANVTSDNFITWYPVVRLPDWVQSEMVWTPTSETGKQLTLIHSYSGKDHIGIQGSYGSATWTSPLVMTSDRAANAKVDLGNSTDLAVRAFSGNMEQDPSGFVGMSVEQDFTTYTHIFYGYTPPEGWTFAADGAVPPPR